MKLHKQYPKWEFEAFKTGLDWNAAVAAEIQRRFKPVKQ